MDALDRKVNDVFGGKVVRKDLVRRVKAGAGVPVYVLEYLIGRYCATDDPNAIEAGLRMVNHTITENFIRPDEANKAQFQLKDRGTATAIDKVRVRSLESKDWAEMANFGNRYLHIPDRLIRQYPRLLELGVWAQVDLEYRALGEEEDNGKSRPFFITDVRPIQIANFEFDDYVQGRRELATDEWLDLLIRSIGLEPAHYDRPRKLLLLMRLVPMAERNYNLIELGPRGTGKSFVYRETSPNSILISGGKTTVAQLFYNLSSGRIGLVGTWDVIAFDEVAGMQFGDSTAVQIMKDYMESGSFARGKEELPAEASMVFLGNINRPVEELIRRSHLFADLPQAMIDAAFIDRLHYYLPGWEAPKMEQRFFTDHYGFISDYLAEAFRQSRRQNFTGAVDEEFAFGSDLNARDERAVKKTISGLLKLLHPHGTWTRAELREYLEMALQGRRRVKEQLKKLAPHEYAKTAFSYVERDTGAEFWVDVPEQPDEPVEVVQVEPDGEGGRRAGADGRQPTPRRSAAELIAGGENTNLEFKETAFWDINRNTKDKVISLAIVKTVAGFMNQEGGTLLIGVNDEGEAVGLDRDYQLWSKGPRAPRDAFENALTTFFEETIGSSATSSNLRLSWEPVDGKDICRIDVIPSRQPVFVKNKEKQSTDFYVRMNNSTRALTTEDALTYITGRQGPSIR
ncbi:MAG: protease Lon-related BREX system protein BrxL [Chloroflexota bacterium]|nr:protease Lon-related BREX system protein BrxL [Chloroflexota bacterium]